MANKFRSRKWEDCESYVHLESGDHQGDDY